MRFFRCGRRGRCVSLLGATLAITCAARRSAAEPSADEDRIHLSASAYYAAIASNLFNVGLHGQATYVATTALELQAIAMTNLPVAGIAFSLVEGSVFLGVPSTQTAYQTTGYGGGYVYGRAAYGQKRRRLGIELGGFFDQRESKCSWYVQSTPDSERFYDENLVPMTSLSTFAGVKWATQSRVDNWERTAMYLHAMYAVRQSVETDVRPDGTRSPSVRFGGRAGMEISNKGVFVKLELAALPSVATPDFSGFFIVGWKPAPAMLRKPE